ncbi:MAG: DNA-formamidopyrimidine glycosylase family protein [Vicinamibacterales bacterium]
MPEGDTIFRSARTLNLALAGKVVTRFTSVYPALTRIDEDAPIAGRIITRVEARGKHLLMHFGPAAGLKACATTLRTHMRMKGSWHIYRPGEAWQRHRSEARIVIETADFVAVGFNVTIAEFLDEKQTLRQEDLRAMGPDLIGGTFDEDAALRRLQQRGTQAIAEALLNQRVVAGIGNVYKSETLFLEAVHPETPVTHIDEQKLRALLRTARTLLQANVADASSEIITYRGLRRTTGRTDPDERLWVYGRGGKPCRRCGAAISYKKTGPDARGTYWCGACQTLKTNGNP